MEEDKSEPERPKEPAPNEELFQIKSIQKLREASSMDIDWIVKDLIEENSSTQIYSDVGIGKSWIGLHLADCLSRGGKFMNKFDCAQKRVLYLDYENGEAEIGRRHRMLSSDSSSEFDVSFSPPLFDDFKTDLSLEGGASASLFRFLNPEFIGKYDVLIVDTLRDSFIGDENQSKDVNKVNMFIRHIKTLGKSIIVLHHSTKGDRTISRGSSAINAKFDNIFQLDKTEEDTSFAYSFSTMKKRRGEHYPTVIFDMFFKGNEHLDIAYRETILQQDEAVKTLYEGMKLKLASRSYGWKGLLQLCEESYKGIYNTTRFNKAVKQLRDDPEVIAPSTRGGTYSLRPDHKQKSLAPDNSEAGKMLEV